jgi:hypothetical protein
MELHKIKIFRRWRKIRIRYLQTFIKQRKKYMKEKKKERKSNKNKKQQQQ